MMLMRAIADVPGSTCELYSVTNLTKGHRKQQREPKSKHVAASAANWFILSFGREQINIDKKDRVLYWTVPEFIQLIIKTNAAARCAGYP